MTCKLNKNLWISCFRTSDQLLEELFGVFGVNVPDLSSGDFQKEKKSKKKKKRKHSGDENTDAESTKSKHKKSKKSKKIKKEPSSDAEDCKEKLRKAIKKEKKDKDKEKKVKKEVTERRKLSIVIKSSVIKPVEWKKSSSRDRDREREKEKRRKSKERERKEKKSSGNVSDVSLSDEETYRKMLEYHTSSQWNCDSRDDFRGGPVREWDRDKYRNSRIHDDDRQWVKKWNLLKILIDSDFSSRYHRGYRSRSRSRDRSQRHSPIDKKRLLEIARKNAISMLKSGTLPRTLSQNTKEKLISKITHGGKSIEELTNYCKRLSRAEDLGDLSELSDSDNDGDGKPRAFHHPFEVKDRGPIVMNIRVSWKLLKFTKILHFPCRIPFLSCQNKQANLKPLWRSSPCLQESSTRK